MKNKRGQVQPMIQQSVEKGFKWWSWIIIISILIAVGIGIYFWFSGGDSGPVINVETNVGNSIPKPPALPSE